MAESTIRNYIAPGGIGWVLALLVLIIVVVPAVIGRGVTTELILVGMLAVARLM